MAVRKLLADAIAAGLADYEAAGDGRRVRVVDDPRSVTPGPLDLALVHLVRNGVEPATHSPLGQLSSTFELWLVLPSSDVAASEGDLDDALDALIDVLDAIPFVDWGKAVRSTYGDSWVAWKFDPLTIALAKD